MGFVVMRFHETKGRWPFTKAKTRQPLPAESEGRQGVLETKTAARETSTAVDA